MPVNALTYWRSFAIKKMGQRACDASATCGGGSGRLYAGLIIVVVSVGAGAGAGEVKRGGSGHVHEAQGMKLNASALASSALASLADRKW